MIIDGHQLTRDEELKVMADAEHKESHDILELWAEAHKASLRANQLRMSTRAVDKLYAEMRKLGHRGFMVTERDGEMFIEPVSAIPEYLRETA